MKTVRMNLSWGYVGQHMIGMAKLFIIVSLDTLNADEINLSYSYNRCNRLGCTFQYRIHLRGEAAQRREPSIKQVVKICIFS
jgi:hypothetical protein